MVIVIVISIIIISSIKVLIFLSFVTSCLFAGGPPEVLMSENPWLCDCELEWLKNINRLSVNSNYARVQDIESMTCITSSPALVSSPVPILLVESKEFLCEYEAHCVANCFCCDFFACDCRMQCPEGNNFSLINQ